MVMKRYMHLLKVYFLVMNSEKFIIKPKVRVWFMHDKKTCDWKKSIYDYKGLTTELVKLALI